MKKLFSMFLYLFSAIFGLILIDSKLSNALKKSENQIITASYSLFLHQN